MAQDGSSPTALLETAASTTAADTGSTVRPLFALKHANTFLIADALGDVLGNADGMFHNDTRMLSRFALRIGGELPALLGAAVSQDNVFLTANVTNRPLPPLGGELTPHGVIHVERSCFLWRDRLYERITVRNYGDRPATVPLSLAFAADFRDMFEVRGHERAQRGRLLPPQRFPDGVALHYQGLDDVRRSCVIAFSVAPAQLHDARADFTLPLDAGAQTEFYVEVGPEASARPDRQRFRAAAAHARVAMRRTRRRGAELRSSAGLFNDWLEKSRADLSLLTTELPTGPYPYAGIPWFSTPFGRDAVVTALQTLWIDPALARGVLAFLAAMQARETSSFEDSAPGKILHETRKGEMTTLKEVPFGRYYGGVDTTPLFVILAGAYAERTSDLDFIDGLWPALEAAMGWIERNRAGNPDGFLDYERASASGLSNQGWKDSVDSVFHRDGRFPRGPIALVEVQGYVFAALQAMGELAHRRGAPEQAQRWRTRADSLRSAVEQRFWDEQQGFYALALDGERQPCQVRTSNPGHLLYVGLPARARAQRVIDQLISPAFNSGWGVRTLARGEPRYNPMSYHNGSIWPHDTAICMAGMCRYGAKGGAVRMLGETFEAAVHFGMRLPELFCGFQRAPAEPPIAYPVACLPQAWSSGAVFMMLQACLGLRIDGRRRQIHVRWPELPQGINNITLHRLKVGDASVDLVFQRIRERVVPFTEGADARAVRVFARV